MAKARSMLGSGAIIVVDDSTPILDVALKVAKFRDELEAEIEAASERANTVPVAPIQDAIPVGAH